LLNNVGNLCNRAFKFAYTEFKKTIPDIKLEELTEVEVSLLKLTEEKFNKYTQLLDKVEIKEGLKTAMEISSIGNKYVQDCKPWTPESK
jgi:methionyl-tRNA synthetase